MATALKARPAVSRQAPAAPGEAPALTKLLRVCNESCAALIREGVRRHTSSVTATIEEKWRLGEIVQDLYDDKNHKPKVPGASSVNGVRLLAEAINCSTSYLNKCGQVKAMFETEADLDRFTSLRTRRGQPLTFAHLEQLMRLHTKQGDNSAYQRLLRLALDEDLTPDQIDQRIRAVKAASGTPLGAGGRPTPIPPTLTGRLSRLLDHTDLIVKNDGEIYSHPDHNFTAAAKDMPQSEVASNAPELRAMIGRARSNMAALKAMFERKAAEFDGLEAYIAQCELTLAHQTGKDIADSLEAAHAESA